MQKLDDNLYFYAMRSMAVLLLVYTVVGFAIYGETEGFTRRDGGVIAAIVLMLLFSVCYTCSQVTIYLGRQQWTWRLLWITGAITLLLHFVASEVGYLLSFVAFWIARTPHHFDFRTCTRLSAAALVFFLLMMYVRGDDGLAVLAVLALLGPAVLFFVLTTAYNAINLQRERQKAMELNRELMAAQLQLAQSSRSGERLRIARDIHDMLGHQMTALILNLEVARHKTTGEALTHVEASLALAKILLSDLRNAVSDMRENPALDFDAALAELLANVPQLEVTLDRQPGFTVEEPCKAEVLLRCIQEALTNTLRHARARTCHIRLHTEHDQLVLDICDDGKSASRVTPGNGLKGMQERINALAGKVQWHSDNGSFHLRAQLPMAGASS